MSLINWIWGWIFANTHGDQNIDLVPWGKRRFALDYASGRSINRDGASLPELVRWVGCALHVHAMDGWHYAAVIEIAENWEDE